MSPVSKKISWEIIKKAMLPAVFILAVGGFYWYYTLRIVPKISPEIYEASKKYIITLFILCGTFAVHRVSGAVFGWYKQNIASKTETKLDDQLVPLLRRTFNTLLWIVALLVILPVYKINISALVTALGVGSLAIALAAQDTIANIIAGFLIMIDSPFTVGDSIKLPSGEMVKVLDIGVRRSKFLAEDKAIVFVPNVDLSKSKIVNYSYHQ
ncbi:MAG: mechanosensitive ion channel [Candidatus Omnitrophica bacterium]|nr:mechanosensitive ion channel [Candidatus Omnitrophota bacterium]